MATNNKGRHFGGSLEENPSYKHGYARRGVYSRVYHIWGAMKRRCFDKNQVGYKNYGARGITVCERWLSENGFLNFLEDMGEPTTARHCLDRIDNNGNYEPNNCRWATYQQQSDNKRPITLTRIEWKGEVKTLEEWKNKLKINRTTIRYRSILGYDLLLGPPLEANLKNGYSYSKDLNLTPFTKP